MRTATLAEAEILLAKGEVFGIVSIMKNRHGDAVDVLFLTDNELFEGIAFTTLGAPNKL